MNFGSFNIPMKIMTLLLALGVGCVEIVHYRQIRETSARGEGTRTQIIAIQRAVERYARNHNGTYPKDLLVFLPEKDDFNCFGDGKAVRDMWGTAFDYKSDGNKFSIRSAGPDMKHGTRDDITN